MTQRPRYKALSLALFFILYNAAMLAALRQWASPHPWARLDRFSGGYILLSLLWLAASFSFLRLYATRQDISSELSGSGFDPVLLKAIGVVSIADLSAFIDYGHLHLCPALERPALQTLGLILSAAGALWLLWADRYLIAHFTSDMSHQGLLEEGPYRFVRHPRYLALIVSRVAFALALASVLAWALLVVWLIFILRRIRLEEAHMRKLFGADYAAYSRRTARLIPGVY